jgi:hypothetical protein
MASVLLICLVVGAVLATASVLLLMVVGLGGEKDEGPPADDDDRRRFTRVPCRFRRPNDAPGAALWSGDLSLGGACVRLPAASLAPRIKVVAVDSHGLAAAATIEGRVVSMQREGGLFAHHLAFDPNADHINVAALVAASAWAE